MNSSIFNASQLTYTTLPDTMNAKINILDVYADICGSMDVMIYRSMILIFIFYMSSKILIPTINNMLKDQNKSYYPVYKIFEEYFLSFTDSLALLSITFVMLLYQIQTYGNYYNGWIIAGLIFSLMCWYINRKINKK